MTIQVAVVDLPRFSDGEIDVDNTASDALAVACHALQRDYNGSTAPAVVAVGSPSRSASGSEPSSTSSSTRDTKPTASALDAVCRGTVTPSALVLLCADARFPARAGGASEAAAAAAGAFDQATGSFTPLGHLSAPLLAIFGGQDDTSTGSSSQDAQDLEAALGQQPGIQDWRVLSMPGCGQGFAHKSKTGSSNSDDDGGAPPWEVDEDAGDAMLLLTAWLDLYNRPVSSSKVTFYVVSRNL